MQENVRVAHSNGTRFKKEDKFSGKLCADLNEAVRLYMDTIRDYKLSSEQKLRYCYRNFDGEARSFYRRKVEQNALSYAGACGLMRDEYNSAFCQKKIRQYFQSLRLKGIIENKRCSAMMLWKASVR